MVSSQRAEKPRGSGLFDSFAHRSDSLTATYTRNQRRRLRGSRLPKKKAVTSLRSPKALSPPGKRSHTLHPAYLFWLIPFISSPTLLPRCLGRDAVGNRTQLTDPVGNETTWTYDALDRVTREENELGAARTFVYDAVSNLTRRTDRLDRVIEYDYDALQRRTAEHWLAANQQILRTIEYAYDGLSRLTGVEDPDSSYATTPIRC